MQGTHILTSSEIFSKFKRIAYQIYEHNYAEEVIHLVGIGERGFFIAQKLSQHLAQISPLRIQLQRIDVDRTPEEGMMQLNVDNQTMNMNGRNVIVVDDVLHSGRTLLSVISQLLLKAPKSLQICVLIDRGHRAMPISPDYVGMELATTLQQHVNFVITEDGAPQAFLQ